VTSDRLYLAFILATTVLMFVPGPNVALIVIASVAQGIRAGLLVVAGTILAIMIQVLFTAFAMAGMLGPLARWFEFFRWSAVCYLLYLGLSQLLEKAKVVVTTQTVTEAGRTIFLRGFFVSLGNPKTLFFCPAFFPHFIGGDAGLGFQLMRLGVTFCLLALIIDSLWALLAGQAQGFLIYRQRIARQLTGAFILLAAVALAWAHPK
jgi:threonine/homoserine/homoserine lactone efflux protein